MVNLEFNQGAVELALEGTIIDMAIPINPTAARRCKLSAEQAHVMAANLTALANIAMARRS